MCIRYDALSFGGNREKRERERERETTQDTRKVVPKEKKNPKNECDLKNRVYENPGFLKLILTLEILIPHPRNKEREREKERNQKLNTKHTHTNIYTKRAISCFLTRSTRALER